MRRKGLSQSAKARRMRREPCSMIRTGRFRTIEVWVSRAEATVKAEAGR